MNTTHGDPSKTQRSSAACKACLDAMPELLLDPTSADAGAARPHLLACASCQRELAELQTASGILDMWVTPEPSSWFDSRLQARLREAAAAPPEGFLERWRSRFLFSTGRELRPILAGALALLLAFGGGGAAIAVHSAHANDVQASATVQDLQILDRNDQAIQTMDQLLDDNTPDDGTTSNGTT